jgi:hypothetical protein
LQQSHGLVGLNEGFMIAGLVLWENKHFANVLIGAGIDLPAISNFIQRGSSTGMIGLNRTAGMDGMDFVHAPEAKLSLSQNVFTERARNYITTGEFQSIKMPTSATGGLKLRLFAIHINKGKAWWEKHPEIHGHDDAPTSKRRDRSTNLGQSQLNCQCSMHWLALEVWSRSQRRAVELAIKM